MSIKTRTKYALKGGIELAVFEAFREVLIEAMSFGFEAWTKLCQDWRGKVSGRSEVVWRMK